MNPDLAITIFVLLGLTIPTAIGGVFLFRGTYYRSLPGRIKELEDSDVRKEAALKRQADELALWKGIATQTPEIRKLLDFYERHEVEADDRHSKLMAGARQNIAKAREDHLDILRHLILIETRLNIRDGEPGLTNE